MIFLILFLILLKDGQCCLGNNNIPMTFEPNKYNATPGCGNDTEATYCTHFDGKEKDFHPKYGSEISNGASYEALYGRERWWLYHNDHHYKHEFFIPDNDTSESWTPTCPSKRVIVTPVKAFSVTANKWKYIAQWFWLSSMNPVDNFNEPLVKVTQRMVIHKCLNPGKPCKGCKDGSICKQLYGKKELVALDDDGNSSVDYFKTPQGCYCFQKNGTEQN